MSLQDLREFITLLEKTGQLARVSVSVDPHLELAAIVNQTVKMPGGGLGLLFEKVRGTNLAVACNLFGSLQRMALAFGTPDIKVLSGGLALDLASTGISSPPQALAAVLKALPHQSTVERDPLWRRSSAQSFGLDKLPAIRAWPGDGGSYLTLGQVYTRDSEAAEWNCGMYRVQVHGAGSATVRFREGSDGARHLASWHRRGQAMPLAIALGGPPLLTWAAGMRLPKGVSEVDFCSYLAGVPLAMSPCQTCDLKVPSSAEWVIEGVVPPGVWRRDGPFGNHTGGYDIEEQAPELQVLSVCCRSEAVYPWTLVGPPPQENIAMARAAGLVLLPLLQLAVPSVRQLHMPDEGIFHGVAFITVAADDVRPLREIAEDLWASDLLKRSRLLVLGGADQDARDPAAVFWRVLNRVNWQRDLLVAGERLAVDARCMSGDPVRSEPEIVAQVLERWADYGIRVAQG
mgnify:CR=1 FL=1